MQQLEQLLGSMGWGRYHSYLFWACGFVSARQGWAADMMWLMLVSVVLNEVGGPWELSDFHLSLYAMSQSAGVFIGSYFWGCMADRRGRMFAFKKTLMLCGFGGCVASLSVNFTMLCVLAFLVGIGVGGDLAVDGVVFIEFCPKSERHMLTLMSAVCVLGSMLVPALAYAYTMMGLGSTWRWVMGTVSLLNLVFAAMRWKALETPHFYLAGGRVEAANQVLEQLSAYNGSTLSSLPLELQPCCQTLMEPRPEVSLRRQVKRLFSCRLRSTTICFLLIWFFTAFTFSGFGVFMPQFLKRAGGPEHSSDADVYSAMTLQQGIGVVSVLGATVGVKSRLGRKWSQALALLASSVFMYVFLAPFAYWAVLLCSTLFYLFGLVAFSVQYTYTPESFPADVRNTGVGFCSAANRLASIVSPLLAGALLDRGAGDAIILYSASLCIAGLLGALTRETKGADIEAEAAT